MRQIIIIGNGINFKQPKLQKALARVLDELERNQIKEKSSKSNLKDDKLTHMCISTNIETASGFLLESFSWIATVNLLLQVT